MPVPVGPAAAGARNLQRRIDAVPESIDPTAFGEFRDYVRRDQAKAYERRLRSRIAGGYADYIVGFLGAIGAPLIGPGQGRDRGGLLPAAARTPQPDHGGSAIHARRAGR